MTTYYFIYRAMLLLVIFIFLICIALDARRKYPVTPDDKFFIKDLEDKPDSRQNNSKRQINK